MSDDDTSRSSPLGTTLWVVCDDGAGCSHAVEDLRERGSDGVNGYYECTCCGAALVLPDEAVMLSASPS